VAFDNGFKEGIHEGRQESDKEINKLVEVIDKLRVEVTEKSHKVLDFKYKEEEY